MYQSVTSPFGLNHSLFYFPWPELLQGISDADKNFIRDRCLGNNTVPTGSIRILPGMKLQIDDVSVYTFGTNVAVPGMGRYAWTVPEGSFGPEDYFFLSYLLMSCDIEHDAEFTSPQNLALAMKNTALHLASLDATKFNQQLSDLMIKNFIPSLLIVHIRTGSRMRPAGTPARVREWLTEPSLDDLQAATDPPRPLQTLRANIPIDTGRGLKNVGIRAFQSGSAFFLDDLLQTTVVPPHMNAWYKGSARAFYARRQRMSLSIPIRTSTVPVGTSQFSGRHYVPIYFSLADAEAELGIKAKAIRRRREFIGCVKDKGWLDIDPDRLVSPLDHRAGISFVSNDPSGAPEIVYLDNAAVKKDLLLAPDDILVIN